jgi:hypothetical protein
MAWIILSLHLIANLEIKEIVWFGGKLEQDTRGGS